MANGYVSAELRRAGQGINTAIGGLAYRINGDGSRRGMLPTSHPASNAERFLSEGDRNVARAAYLALERAQRDVDDAVRLISKLDLEYL